jgi:hypothetical protein
MFGTRTKPVESLNGSMTPKSGSSPASNSPPSQNLQDHPDFQKLRQDIQKVLDRYTQDMRDVKKQVLAIGDLVNQLTNSFNSLTTGQCQPNETLLDLQRRVTRMEATLRPLGNV